MAYQSLNQADHINGLQKFIQNEGHDLPDWMNHQRESAFSEYEEVCPEQSRSATWKNTKLNQMLDIFLDKDFKKLMSSHKDFDLTTGLDDSIRIYFHAGMFFCDEEIPTYIKILSHQYSEENSSIFSIDGKSKRQSIPFLLNNIVSRDALLIDTSVNQNVERLVHIIYVPNQNINVAPRININLAENSSIKILEEQLQLNDSIINQCIDIKCAEGSSLDYYKINHPQNDSHQINNLNLNQDAMTDVSIFNLDLGANSASALNHLKLNGKDSHVSCSTLFMPSGERSSHHNVVIDHLSDESSSSVNFRGVINDRATGSFFGKVRVAKERRKTSAFMQNKNLLLSDESKISTVPILEIYNDDTECSHSATSGSLDKEKLFYLKTRGISEYDAKDFLIKSFIDELTSQIKSRRIRDYINELILSNHES